LSVNFLHKRKKLFRVLFNITEKTANFQKINVFFKVSTSLFVYLKQKKSWNLPENRVNLLFIKSLRPGSTILLPNKPEMFFRKGVSC